jgi:hypothetical protein
VLTIFYCRECVPGQCASLGLSKLFTVVSNSMRVGRQSRAVAKGETHTEREDDIADKEGCEGSDGGSESNHCCLNTAIQTRTYPMVEVFLTESEPTPCAAEAVASSTSRSTSRPGGKRKLQATDTNSASKGYGLRLGEAVDRGTIIVEYLGEVITAEEGLRRMKHYSAEDAFYFAGLDNGLMLDAKAMGSVARFANHSCDPSCELQKWTVQGECRLVLVALREMLAGDEVRTLTRCVEGGGRLHLSQQCIR